MGFARAAAAWFSAVVFAAGCISAPESGAEAPVAVTAEPWGALPAAPAVQEPATAVGERECPEGQEWVDQVGDCWSLTLPATPQDEPEPATAQHEPEPPPVKPGAAPGSGSPEPSGAGVWDELAAMLDGLTVASEHREGYDRERWAHWSDLDGNGCDTRREVLLEEAVVAPAVGEGCRLSGGVWISAYDGAVEEGTGRGFDVDHLVPLYEAHKSGGHSWGPERRELYANDLGHPDALIAVSASSNRQKGASDPAEWLPYDIDVRCWYSAAWIEVKHRWGLTVDTAEKAALADLLASCSQGGGASTR
ncbi:MAG: hypothetical protein F4Z31_20820 [Gemmatimonadetes bacterium]|nr:hypothetical protein [Gemmatimonadota bacterium]MYJ63647.1 hypothetical protein [Acidimicrobiia bacterium]